MRTYSVILVDDENAVKNAIARILDWKELGFEVIATAKSAGEALELAERMHPNVVLTDVKMPFMDGLALCRKLKRKQKNIKVIIFSDYKDYEYMKEAIYLGVEDYLLKPIRPDELRNAFLKIKDILDEEAENKVKQDRLDGYYKKCFPKMQDQFLMGVLNGEVHNEQDITDTAAECKTELSAPFYMAVDFRIDRGRKDGIASLHKEQMAFSFKEMLDEKNPEGFSICSMLYLEEVAAIILLEGKDYFNRAVWEMDQLCKNANEQFGIHVTAGVGQIVEQITDLNASWKGAQDAAALRLFLEPDQAICISDIRLEMDKDFSIDEQVISKLLMDIKIGEEEELRLDVNELIGQFKGKKIALYKYQTIVMEIVVEVLKLADAYSANAEEFFGEQFDICQEMQRLEDLDDVKEWIYDICLWLRTSIRREKKDSTKLLMDSAKQFINENYSDATLSVKVLCNRLNVSAAYFSTVFKRETGKNFVEYLTDIRLETARELLNNTDDKTYVISAKVGYLEPNYFSYVFKKKYGIAPSKYRTEKKQK